MIFRRLGFINKNQVGYTLVEVIVALAIIGFITAGIATTIFQVITIEARTSNHMTAVRQVQNAGYWISHDGQMAQYVDPGAASGLPITLTWEDWDGTNEYQVVYSLVNNTELQREHYTNRTPTSDPDATTIVAQYIDTDPTKTKCEFAYGVLTLTVTATVSVGWLEGSETRVYEVIPRPDEVYH